MVRLRFIFSIRRRITKIKEKKQPPPWIQVPLSYIVSPHYTQVQGHQKSLTPFREGPRYRLTSACPPQHNHTIENLLLTGHRPTLASSARLLNINHSPKVRSHVRKQANAKHANISVLAIMARTLSVHPKQGLALSRAVGIYNLYVSALVDYSLAADVSFFSTNNAIIHDPLESRTLLRNRNTAPARFSFCGKRARSAQTLE